jgi:hypothetical protein
VKKRFSQRFAVKCNLYRYIETAPAGPEARAEEADAKVWLYKLNSVDP